MNISDIKLIRKKSNTPLKLNIKNDVPYLTFPKISSIPGIRHMLTTRLGGVSTGNLFSFNLAQREADDPANVLENYKRAAAILEIAIDQIATTKQTHTVNVRVATKEDGGKGIIKEKDYDNIDALITNEPGLCLCAFSADCVPIMFIDPAKRAIGVAHSGWKGTVGAIAQKVIEALNSNYGCEPKDIITAIGPSICRDCYEVGLEVAEQFNGDIFKGDKPVFLRRQDKKEEKYLLNLWEANRRILLNAGVLPDHIHVTDICTKCNPKILYSYRHDGNPVGNLGMFVIMES